MAASAADFAPLQLESKKIGVLTAVTTNEVARQAGDGFGSALSIDLIRSIAQVEAATLLDPLNAGTDDSPASLTNAVTPVPSSGTDAEAVRADLAALLADFAGDTLYAVLAMHPNAAMAAGLLLGLPEQDVRRIVRQELASVLDNPDRLKAKTAVMSENMKSVLQRYTKENPQSDHGLLLGAHAAGLAAKALSRIELLEEAAM